MQRIDCRCVAKCRASNPMNGCLGLGPRRVSPEAERAPAKSRAAPDGALKTKAVAGNRGVWDSWYMMGGWPGGNSMGNPANGAGSGGNFPIRKLLVEGPGGVEEVDPATPMLASSAAVITASMLEAGGRAGGVAGCVTLSGGEFPIWNILVGGVERIDSAVPALASGSAVISASTTDMSAGGMWCAGGVGCVGCVVVALPRTRAAASTATNGSGGGHPADPGSVPESAIVGGLGMGVWGGLRSFWVWSSRLCGPSPGPTDPTCCGPNFWYPASSGAPWHGPVFIWRPLRPEHTILRHFVAISKTPTLAHN